MRRRGRLGSPDGSAAGPRRWHGAKLIFPDSETAAQQRPAQTARQRHRRQAPGEPLQQQPLRRFLLLLLLAAKLQRDAALQLFGLRAPASLCQEGAGLQRAGGFDGLAVAGLALRQIQPLENILPGRRHAVEQ